MSTAQLALQDLKKKASNKRALGSARFFKTGPGEYGEGDLFLGVSSPDIRLIAKTYKDLNPLELQKLMSSKLHEVRFLGFLICTHQYQTQVKIKEFKKSEKLVKLYLKNKKFLNNWDLIDVTVPHILGHYYFQGDRQILTKWINSKNLWERRMALLTTFYFLRQDDYAATLDFCTQVLNDREDLIHKASGWMLREVGKRNEKVLLHFLQQYSKLMPRTMLRYSIEKLSIPQKKYFMKK